jgi:hypothetical protein
MSALCQKRTFVELKQQADFWGPLIARIGVTLD